MRRLASVVAFVGVLLVVAGPASGQTGVVERAASHLRSDPVYVDPEAERGIDDASADRLRQRIRDSGAAIFIAVLPSSAVADAGGEVNRLPEALGSATGLTGTYGVVAGNSFRAGSNFLPAGQAGSLATASFQARSGDGTAAVLEDFVDRVVAVQGAQSPSPSASGPFDDPQAGGGEADDGGDGGGGGSSALPLLLLIGAGGAGLWFWSRNKRQKAQVEDQRNRSVLEAQLSILADDVVNLDPLVTTHPDAGADYEAAVSRYRVAQAALANPSDPIDLVKVGRLLDEAQYAMSRARAIVEGREPPGPPPELTRPGRRGEPPVDLDERGRPAYVGSGASPFYGGGWFGGGSGLLTGLFLGQMLGGGWGGGYGGHDTNVYVDNDGG
ncbi:MAG: hypothetical protein QOE93_833, partial [Actinomycetota bacterium]|nr:hypothetical protein [Actinomycetota bacterium]